MNLFFEQSFLDYQRNILRSFEKEIEEQADSYILNVNEEKYLDYLVEKYCIEPVVISFDDISASSSYKMIRAELFPTRFHVREGREYKTRILTYHIPYTGNPKLLYCKPHKRYIGWTKDVSVENNEISFEIINFDDDAKKINSNAKETIQSIKTQYELLVKEVDEFNNDLRAMAQRSLKGKKERVMHLQEFLQRIEVPIRKSTDTPSTFSVPVTRKKIQPKIQKPEVKDKGYIPEPIIIESEYKEILHTIHTIGKQFERMPGTYKDKGEETLRDHFLIILETNFEGSATGETFNKAGKTDILIRHESSNLFIAECKVWKGAKQYLSAIDQLLTYLTWRDSKAAIILFIGNKNLSSVIKNVIEVTPSHGNYLKQVDKQDETWINYLFHIPGDTSREVHLAVMMYHFP